MAQHKNSPGPTTITARSCWEEFAFTTLPREGQFSETQYREMRKAFYGGFSALFFIFANLGDKDATKEKGEVQLLALYKELAEFYKKGGKSEN